MISTKQVIWLSILFLNIAVLGLGIGSCAKRQKKNKEQITKPLRPNGSIYSSYDPQYNWALEMEIDGNFSFIDYTNNIDVHCKTSEFQSFQEENKQGLVWVMRTSDSLQVRVQIADANCYNFGFQNNPFVLELSNEHGVLYRVGGCGCYHPNFGFRDTYVLSTINNQDCKTSGNLSEAPQLQLSKMKTSNLIEGRFGCRTWRSQLNILERTFAFNFDLYPNMSCHESPELSQLMERMGGKPYYFLFSENNNKLTLSDKNDTFVFIKTK